MSVWFETWFDSPYYHLLYNHRNDGEAKLFIENITEFIDLKQNQKIVDMACGKGRHAKVFSQLGFEVLGMDLSPNSIKEATKMEEEMLKFKVHDMRNEFPVKNQDAIFNIFTSLGYFDSVEEHLPVFNHVYDALKQNGYFVIDFMNGQKVMDNLVHNEIVAKEDIVFKISRKIINQRVEKIIEFKSREGKDLKYTESVLLLFEENFKYLLKKSGFEMHSVFGNYNLESFEVDSPRFILVARKV